MSLTLDQIRGSGAAFPTARLTGLDTALVLFAAGFGGKQDAIFVADAGLRGTCVDMDADLIDRMRPAYPDTWEYSVADAFHYARTWKTAGRKWDAVTVDCPTNLFDKCAAELPLFCDIARRLVVLGTGVKTHVEAPEGWAVAETIRRSDFQGGVQWTVLERQWS